MKINDIINEGYFVLPTMDRERYTDLSKEGLEGPFMTRSGKVVYYDPKEGKYYDRDSDMYLSDEEYSNYDSPAKNIAEHINETVIVNEVQYILKAVQGFTVTLGNMEDPRQETQLNLADKKIDMTGEQGITITDELSPAERTNMLRRAKGAVVDVQVSNMR
jgi:hypothetical protein